MTSAAEGLVRGVVTPELIRRVEAISVDVVARGPVRREHRDDVVADVRLALLEAWCSLQVREVSGLYQQGMWAARSAALEWSTGVPASRSWRWRRAGHLPRLDPVDMAPGSPTTATIEGRSAPAVRASEQSPAGALVAETLDRLVVELTARGMPEERARTAVDALVDLCATAPRGARGVHATSARQLGEELGLHPWSARTLVILVVGQPRRDALRRAGLIERAVDGADVWSDPRVVALIDQVAQPRVSRVKGAWADLEPDTAPGPAAEVA